MPRQRLVIDGSDHGHFYLQVHEGTLKVGPEPAQAGLVLGNLRIVRLHCEVEVEESPVLLANGSGASSAAQGALQPGQVLNAGGSYVSLMGTTDTAADAEDGDIALADESQLTPTADESPAAHGTNKRFFVVDGADKGRVFPLNVTGRIAIGKSSNHADIVLHDLLISRVHCELQVDDDAIVVSHVEGQSGTLVNGMRITRHTLQLGDVLRIGNSQLRLELDDSSPETVEEVEVVEEVEGDTELVAPITSPLDEVYKLEGQLLGHYQIGPILGRGQSGVVFQAEDKKSNLAVALKVLAPTFPASDAELQGLIRVLKAVAPLRHPHLLTLYGAGKTGPYCWIAREHVPGENLAALVERLAKEGRLGWKRGCRVAVQLGWVLNFLNLRHVLHTCITPANILIEAGTKAAKLADVMLDKALEGSKLAAAIHEERLLAELPYRAPEQFEPGAQVDERATLYSLGTVLYALMAGQPPYSGVSANDIIRKVREGKLVKPSKYVREIPQAFETAILKLLSRRPEDRFQSAAEFVEVVEPIATEYEIEV
jgi:pSer/pThr/pTyr-binding forkhead associated (FHA) protein